MQAQGRTASEVPGSRYLEAGDRGNRLLPSSGRGKEITEKGQDVSMPRSPERAVNKRQDRCVSRVPIYPHVPEPFMLELTRSCTVAKSKRPVFIVFPSMQQNDRGLRQRSCLHGD